MVGVRSSTAGQWAVRRTYHPEGLARDTRKGRGIFRPFNRLSNTQRSRTQLSALRDLKPDLVVINFASNDSAGYGRGNPQAFVENAQYLTNYFNKPVIWFDGGFATRTEPRKRPMVNFRQTDFVLAQIPLYRQRHARAPTAVHRGGRNVAP